MVLLWGVLLQAVQRVTYRVEAVRVADGVRRLIGSAVLSGPVEMDLRLALGTQSAEVAALVSLEAERDSATLVADFFSKRRVGWSRRGLPVWEQDDYRREARLAWGDTARIYPFGPPRRGASDSVWIAVTVERQPAGGETRPTEMVGAVDPEVAFAVEAVVRPRRARVALALARNDSVSAPRGMDLLPEGPGRRVDLRLGRGMARPLDVALTRPEPPTSARDRALAVDADVVCLRVTARSSVEPVRVVCGRLNNVARRLPLPDGDTLVVTFAWPGPR